MFPWMARCVGPMTLRAEPAARKYARETPHPQPCGAVCLGQERRVGRGPRRWTCKESKALRCDCVELPEFVRNAAIPRLLLASGVPQTTSSCHSKATHSHFKSRWCRPPVCSWYGRPPPDLPQKKCQPKKGCQKQLLRSECLRTGLSSWRFTSI